MEKVIVCENVITGCYIEIETNANVPTEKFWHKLISENDETRRYEVECDDGLIIEFDIKIGSNGDKKILNMGKSIESPFRASFRDGN